MVKQRAAVVRRLERASGDLSKAAIDRMEQTLPWFREMPAESRSWVGLVAQAGVAAFVDWFRDPGDATSITADVFGTAPRELVRMVTLAADRRPVRTTIEVVEEHVDELAEPPRTRRWLRESVLRYSREIAFAAAQVYAQAAEARGAWDARLEALVVDALLRGEVDDDVALARRRARLGRPSAAWCVVRGRAPTATPRPWSRACSARRATHRSTCSPACRASASSWCSATSPTPAVAARVRRSPSSARPGRGRTRSCPTSLDAGRSRARVRSPGSGAAWRGRTRRVRCSPTTCSPSARSPATRRRRAPRRSRTYDRPLADGPGAARDRWRRTSSAGAVARGRRPRSCSCTPTPCGTGCAGSPTSPA